MPLLRSIYFFISSLGLLCIAPLLPLIVCKPKYRKRIFNRLGYGLHKKINRVPQTAGPTIWIHALSVGEVTSALPLVRELRTAKKDALLVFSATTSSGASIAQSLIAPHVDCLIDAPLDLGPIVPYYLRCINPHLFIQVETDFWPHWLACLQRSKVPTFLVNGRISDKSFQRYHRFSWIFSPMFNSLTLLSMQTENDARKMRTLGIASKKILTLGNLKFDTNNSSEIGTEVSSEQLRKDFGFAINAPVWICGSTHPGEEDILFRLYRQLVQQVQGLQLLLAPRNIERAEEILRLARSQGLKCRRRTDSTSSPEPVLILDTIGELAGCYHMGEVAFVGGSLVDFGGHNPLEPASVGIPVLVGPHTQDFSEITQGLIEAGGIFQSGREEEITQWLLRLLSDDQMRQRIGAQGNHWISEHRGVVSSHLKVIERLLASSTFHP